MYRLAYFFSLIMIADCTSSQPHQWDQQSFFKPEENPILGADSSYTFFCPVQQNIVYWQQADIFNPAAIVKDNKVYLFSGVRIIRQPDTASVPHTLDWQSVMMESILINSKNRYSIPTTVNILST